MSIGHPDDDSKPVGGHETNTMIAAQTNQSHPSSILSMQLRHFESVRRRQLWTIVYYTRAPSRFRLTGLPKAARTKNSRKALSGVQ
jgi:hypothetical protein